MPPLEPPTIDVTLLPFDPPRWAEPIPPFGTAIDAALADAGRQFNDAIRDYMRRFAYANARAADLWAALGRASGEPIGEVAHEWTHQAGFPLVELGRDGDGGATVRLAQRRFFADTTRMRAEQDRLLRLA